MLQCAVVKKIRLRVEEREQVKKGHCTLVSQVSKIVPRKKGKANIYSKSRHHLEVSRAPSPNPFLKKQSNDQVHSIKEKKKVGGSEQTLHVRITDGTDLPQKQAGARTEPSFLSQLVHIFITSQGRMN